MPNRFLRSLTLVLCLALAGCHLEKSTLGPPVDTLPQDSVPEDTVPGDTVPKDTAKPNLHYCDWIRGWTDVCLRIYGELAERNPAFLAQFDRQPMAEKVA